MRKLQMKHLKKKEAAVDWKDKKEKKTVPDIKQRMNVLMHQ